LIDHLQPYTLGRVSEITWVPREQIVKAVHLFSQTKPACIQWGMPSNITETVSSVRGHY